MCAYGWVVVDGAFFLLQPKVTHRVSEPAEYVQNQVAQIRDERSPEGRLLERLLALTAAAAAR